MPLLQGDDKQIVKAGANVCAHVDDVRIDDLDKRPDHLARSDSEKLVLLRRLSHHDAGVDRILPARDLPDVEDGELRGLRIVAKMVAEWTFHPALARGNDALEHELRIRRNHHTHGLRSNHGYAFTAKKTGKSNFIDVLRKREDRSHHEDRIGS